MEMRRRKNPPSKETSDWVAVKSRRENVLSALPLREPRLTLLASRTVRGANEGGDRETPVGKFCCRFLIDACTTTNLNEGYVGATFWDMHDKVSDGSDTLWFNARGAVPALYLNAGMKQKMSDYRETFRNAANAEHRPIIDGIFEMNHTK